MCKPWPNYYCIIRLKVQRFSISVFFYQIPLLGQWREMVFCWLEPMSQTVCWRFASKILFGLVQLLAEIGTDKFH